MKDRKLIKQCQKGEQEAFEQLIRLYYPYVTGYLVKTCRDESLTEDLTQDTFLKMIQKIDSFDPDGNAEFGTWLITIARNGYIDHLRKNRSVYIDPETLVIDSGYDTAAEVYRKMEYEEACRAISALPEEQAIPIRMKYIEDMTLEEIASRTGIPSKTIKSRIHEGTVKLRRKLKPRKGAL